MPDYLMGEFKGGCTTAHDFKDALFASERFSLPCAPGTPFNSSAVRHPDEVRLGGFGPKHSFSEIGLGRLERAETNPAEWAAPICQRFDPIPA